MKLLLRSCCLIIALLVSGCVHTYPPEIAGQRLNAQGEVTQRIFRVNRGVTHSVLGPDGPRDYTSYTCRYYFQEDGKPKREFFIGDTRKNPFMGPFLAVNNSPLWVMLGETIIWTNRPEATHIVIPSPTAWPNAKPYTSERVDDLHVWVFDDQGFFRHRTFMALQKGEGKMLPEGQIYSADYTMEDGNRTVAFKSPNGLKKYDVVNDMVTNAR